MEDKLNFYNAIKFIILGIGIITTIIFLFNQVLGTAIIVALSTGLTYVVFDYFITLLETLFDISLKAEYIADDIYSKNKMGEEK